MAEKLDPRQVATFDELLHIRLFVSSACPGYWVNEIEVICERM